MKKQFLIIGMLLISAVAGGGVALLQDSVVIPFARDRLMNVEEKYSIVRGTIASFNKRDDVLSFSPATNTPSETKNKTRALHITPRTKIFPFALLEKENDIISSINTYPFVLGNKDHLREGVWVSALVYESGSIARAVELYYETDPKYVK